MIKQLFICYSRTFYFRCQAFTAVFAYCLIAHFKNWSTDKAGKHSVLPMRCAFKCSRNIKSGKMRIVSALFPAVWIWIAQLCPSVTRAKELQSAHFAVQQGALLVLLLAGPKATDLWAKVKLCQTCRNSLLPHQNSLKERLDQPKLDRQWTKEPAISSKTLFCEMVSDGLCLSACLHGRHLLPSVFQLSWV